MIVQVLQLETILTYCSNTWKVENAPLAKQELLDYPKKIQFMVVWLAFVLVEQTFVGNYKITCGLNLEVQNEKN